MTPRRVLLLRLETEFIVVDMDSTVLSSSVSVMIKHWSFSGRPHDLLDRYWLMQIILVDMGLQKKDTTPGAG